MSIDPQQGAVAVPAERGSRRLLLVGNPNVGKSAIFGVFTGRYVTVSNYPGTTVEVTNGSATLGGRRWEVVDTPGINTLIPQSEDGLRPGGRRDPGNEGLRGFQGPQRRGGRGTGQR